MSITGTPKTIQSNFQKYSSGINTPTIKTTIDTTSFQHNNFQTHSNTASQDSVKFGQKKLHTRSVALVTGTAIDTALVGMAIPEMLEGHYGLDTVVHFAAVAASIAFYFAAKSKSNTQEQNKAEIQKLTSQTVQIKACNSGLFHRSRNISLDIPWNVADEEKMEHLRQKFNELLKESGYQITKTGELETLPKQSTAAWRLFKKRRQNRMADNINAAWSEFRNIVDQTTSRENLNLQVQT